MRINGFEQIKAFYSIVFEQKYPIKPQHISLYVFLINQNNRNNWVEWFKCPFDLAMAGACIGSKATYYQCLKDLKEWNLLDFEKGVNNWKAPKIKLEVLNCTPTYTSTVPQSEPLSVPAPEPLSVLLPIHIYKLITNNLKLITLNLEKWIKSELEISIPPYAEFLQYAKTLEIYKAELDYSLKAKYDSWVESGWKDGHGKKILKWKGKLANTIIHLKPTEPQNNSTSTIPRLKTQTPNGN